MSDYISESEVATMKKLEAAVQQRDQLMKDYGELKVRCEKIRGISQYWCDRATGAEKQCDTLKTQRFDLEKDRDMRKNSAEQYAEAARKWQTEAERWRVVSVEKVEENQELRRWKKEATEMLSKWDAVDEFVRSDPRLTVGDSVVVACLAALKRERVEIEKLRDEKERELERMEFRSGIRSVFNEIEEKLKLGSCALIGCKNYDSDAETRVRCGSREEKGRGLAWTDVGVATKEAAQQIMDEIFRDLPEEEEENPAVTVMKEAVEHAKKGTVFGVAEGVAALPNEDMRERLPEGYSFYGKGPLKHLSVVDDDEVAMWDDKDCVWDISSVYEGSDEAVFYALKNGSQVAVANGVLALPHSNPVKECADAIRKEVEEYAERVTQKAQLHVDPSEGSVLEPGKTIAHIPNAVINIYL